jgi:hypothetical protein
VDHYVIRKRGLVEQTNGTPCAACHTRVLPDGSALKGGQIDFAVYPAFAASFKQAKSNPEGLGGRASSTAPRPALLESRLARSSKS